jgi:hypothetical protein
MVCKRFQRKGYLKKWKLLQMFFHGKAGKHCCIPQHMAQAYEQSRTGYFYGTNTPHLSVDLLSPLTSGIRLTTGVKFYLITKDTK